MVVWLVCYLRACEVETPAHVVHVCAVKVGQADVTEDESEDHLGHVPFRAIGHFHILVKNYRWCFFRNIRAFAKMRF